MPSFKYSSDKLQKIVLGRDFNYYNKVVPTISLGTAFNTDCDVLITFPTKSVTFQLEGSGTLQYSFNGNTVHGDMQNGFSSANLIFEDRQISKIWLRGTGTLRIEAWGVK